MVTHFPISIGRPSLNQILGVLRGIFHFCSNSDRTFCEQIVTSRSAASDQCLRSVGPQNAPLHNMLAYCVPCIHNMLHWNILCTLHTQYATRGAYCVGSVHMLFQWSSEGTQYALLEMCLVVCLPFFLTVLSTSICLSYEPYI